MPKSQTVEIKTDMDIKPNIIVSGIELKFLSTTKYDYGENILFQILDEKQLQYILK